MRCLDEVSLFERIVWVNLVALTPENATCLFLCEQKFIEVFV